MRAVLVVSISFLVSGMLSADDTQPKRTLPEADFKLTVAEFEKEFNKKEKGAQEKYVGKIVELRGTITNTIHALGSPISSVEIETPDPTVKSGNPTALCTFNDPRFFTNFGIGQTVRIKGKVSESGMLLDSCELVEKGPDTRAIIFADDLAEEFTANQQMAKKKYEKKTLVISGTISALTPTKVTKGNIVQLKGDGKTTIECNYVDGAFSEKLKVGDRVKVYGSFMSGDGGVVVVRWCFPLPTK